MGKKMSCASKCELVQFRVTSGRLLHVSPRPGSDAPQDLEQILGQRVKEELEVDIHDCPNGCECAIGEPVQVESRDQIKQVTDGKYTAWYRVTLVKYRTPGECMPAEDELPDDARKTV